MDRNITSEVDSTMLASRIFDNIITQIQNSSLNFQIQLSPFAANISLKKSLIKDKSGSIVFPMTSSLSKTDSESTVLELEKRFQRLQKDYENAVEDLAAVDKVVESLTKENQELKQSVMAVGKEENSQQKRSPPCLELPFLGPRHETSSPEQTSAAILHMSPLVSTPLLSRTGEIPACKHTDENSEEIDTIEDVEEISDVDINYNVKVSNTFDPLQFIKDDVPDPSYHPSSLQQPSTCPSPTPQSRCSAQPYTPQRTPETSSNRVRNPDFEMSFNLDSKLENMQQKLVNMIRNLEEKYNACESNL